MKIDSVLQQDVLAELAWEPSIDARAIDVAAAEGVVTLSGHVPSFAEKWAAEYVAKHVAGVHSVVSEITVELPSASARGDSDIALAALNALEWDVWVPHDRVTVTVSNGWVILNGTLDTQHQRQAAERVVRTLTGVQGVTNLIKVMPKVHPTDVRTKILSAFQRSAMLDARKIEIESDGRKIVLRGTVRDWDERETAERAAWAAPGVAEVENHIVVQPVMTCKDKLAAYLRDNHVWFETQHHRAAYTAQEVAASEHLPGQQVAKVVIAIADDALAMVVLPANRRADLVKLRAALGARSLRLADEHDFARRFGDCELGTMPPFGNLYDLPVYVDRMLAEDETFVFQAGTHTDTMRIRYADFARLAKPTIVDITRSPSLATAR